MDMDASALTAGKFTLKKGRELGRGEFGVVYEGMWRVSRC